MQFAMTYIRALVMSAYKEINCLISQPKHYAVGTQKNRLNEGGGNAVKMLKNSLL